MNGAENGRIVCLYEFLIHDAHRDPQSLLPRIFTPSFWVENFIGLVVVNYWLQGTKLLQMRKTNFCVPSRDDISVNRHSWGHHKANI